LDTAFLNTLWGGLGTTYGVHLGLTEKRVVDFLLFHDLLSVPILHHIVWSVITAHKLTPAKRNVTSVVSDQRSRFTAPSIGDYNTPDTGHAHKTISIRSSIHTEISQNSDKKISHTVMCNTFTAIMF